MRAFTIIGAMLILVSLVGLGASVDWSSIVSTIPPIIVDPPEPPPIDGDGLSVLIVRETLQTKDLPASQVGIFTSVDLRRFIESHDGELQILDPDVDTQFIDSKWSQGLQQPRDSLPWIYISNGTSGTSVPLPANVDETKDLIERFVQ